jgi:integrase
LGRDLAAANGKSATRGATARAQSYRVLRAILNDAVRYGAITRNPCVIPGAGNSHAKERPVATPLQVGLIAAGMPARYQTLVKVAAWSGLRSGELRALTRKDIDLSDPEPLLNVTKAVYRVNGQDQITTPKTAAGTRRVHLPSFLKQDMTEHLRLHVGKAPDALVFGTCVGSYLGDSNLATMFRRAVSKAGMSGLRFHDLRHTGATWAAQSGATTKDLMARLGHASPAAALRYQHSSTERDRAIAQALAIKAAEESNNVTPLQLAANK